MSVVLLFKHRLVVSHASLEGSRFSPIEDNIALHAFKCVICSKNSSLNTILGVTGYSYGKDKRWGKYFQSVTTTEGADDIGIVTRKYWDARYYGICRETGRP